MDSEYAEDEHPRCGVEGQMRLFCAAWSISGGLVEADGAISVKALVEQPELLSSMAAVSAPGWILNMRTMSIPDAALRTRCVESALLGRSPGSRWISDLRKMSIPDAALRVR